MNDDVVFGGKPFEKIVVVTTREFHVVEVPILVVLRPVDVVRGRELGASLLLALQTAQTSQPQRQPDKHAGAADTANLAAWTVQRSKKPRRSWATQGVVRAKSSPGRFGPLAEEDVPEDYVLEEGVMED